MPLERLEREYLPFRDGDDEFSDVDETGGLIARDGDNVRNRSQNLHGFIRKVRHELICWELRREAIELLKEELGLLPHQNDEDEQTDGDSDPGAQRSRPGGLYGIQSIEATAFEARQARITWTDGTVARIKISNRGLVERAVVVGESGRIKGVENLLVDGESRIEELVAKLKVLVGEAS